MTNRTQVPVPFRERFRDFRYGILPPLTFCAVVCVVAWLWNSHIRPDAVPARALTDQADCVTDGTALTSAFQPVNTPLDLKNPQPQDAFPRSGSAPN
jgi:hypothetical protein